MGDTSRLIDQPALRCFGTEYISSSDEMGIVWLSCSILLGHMMRRTFRNT